MKRIQENRVEIDLSELIIFLTGKNISFSKLKDIRRGPGKVAFIFDEDIKKSITTYEEQKFLATTLEDLDLSVRSYNFLKKIGEIKTAEDILLNSEKIRLSKEKQTKIQQDLRTLFKKNGFIIYV